jgi:hypothetical protein
VTITAWPQGAGVGSPLTFIAEAIIKETDSGVNLAAVMPTIDFTGSSPASNSVQSGGSVNVGAIASANGDGVTLTSMNFYCDQIRLVDLYGSTSQWALSAATDTKSFYWNTAAVDASSGARVWQDGWRTLRVEVWDSNGKQSFAERQILIDNSPPGTPSPFWAYPALTDTSQQVEWGTAMDGTNPADHYTLGYYKQTASDWLWLGSRSVSATGTTVSSLNGLSRYAYVVWAMGPAPLNQSSPATFCVGVTRPTVSAATWRNVQGGSGNSLYIDTSYNFTIAPPTFPHSTTVIQLARSTSSNMASPTYKTVASWTPTDTVRSAIAKKPAATPYYYQAIVTINHVPHSPKFIANIFNALAGQNINIDIISQTSPQKNTVNISFSLNQEDLNKAVSTINNFKKQEGGMYADIMTGVTKLTVEGIALSDDGSEGGHDSPVHAPDRVGDGVEQHGSAVVVLFRPGIA